LWLQRKWFVVYVYWLAAAAFHALISCQAVRGLHLFTMMG
jgi:hypothetical protein